MDKSKTVDLLPSGAPNIYSDTPLFIADIETIKKDVDGLKSKFTDGSLIALREMTKLEKRLDSHDKRIYKIEEFIKDIPHFFNGDD